MFQAAVSANNIHDSLNIIYPTPPTPLQQFSPLNTNPILPEDPQAKRRRLVECDEYSEPEQEDDIGPKEQDQTSKTVNTFLSVENLAAVSWLFRLCLHFLLFLGFVQTEGSYFANLPSQEA